MHKKSALFLPLLASVLVSGCFEFNFGTRDNIGYVPVYGEASRAEIRLVGTRPIENPGKIYVYGTYLLVNERSKGIHVFDNRTPSKPEGLGFIELLGNFDMAMRNEVLYADHMGSIVAITLNDFNALETKGRVEVAPWSHGVPPPQGHYYQCVESEKGLVVEWKPVSNQNLKCYAGY